MSRYAYCYTTDPNAEGTGGPRDTLVQDGWTDDGRRVMVPIRSEWKKLERCGHMTPETDPECTGCARRTW